MKTLAERMADAMDSSSSARVRASRVAEIVEQHDAVMAQMAEALRECRKFCFANHPRSMADSALSAHQLLGEQP